MTGDGDILFTSYFPRSILNIYTALQINRLSILPDFRWRREEGCSVGNFVQQRFTPHRFHFSICETHRDPRARVHAVKRLLQSLTTSLPLRGCSAALNTVTSEALSADFDSIWTSVWVWEGGSMVKRITQNSPMRCSVTACQFFSSIHPSILPSFARSSFHLPVWGYLCLFLPPSRQYCPSVACFPHPSPLCTSPASHHGFNPAFKQKCKKENTPPCEAIKSTSSFNQIPVQNASCIYCVYRRVAQPTSQCSPLQTVTT